MTRTQKWGVVAGGYAAALAAGLLAGWAYDRSIPAAVRDASSGMYGFGQLLAAVAVFGFTALLPTIAALVFLRPYAPLWRTLSGVAVAFAAAGLVAALVFTFGAYPNDGPGALGSLFALAHMLGFPLWTLAFGIFAVLTPDRGSRRRWVAALGIELVVAAFSIVHFAGAYVRH